MSTSWVFPGMYYVVVSPDGVLPKITVPMVYFSDKVEMVKQAPNRDFPV